MNKIEISGTVTIDFDALFLCIKTLAIINGNAVSIKHRIFGEEINYESNDIDIYIHLYKSGVQKAGNDKRNDYLFDCAFLEEEYTVEFFLSELTELLENRDAIYSFEYEKLGNEIEINNY